MIQRRFGFIDDLEPGAPVWFIYERCQSWRTGTFVRRIRRGRRAGLVEIAPTMEIPRKRIQVRPDLIEPIKTRT